MDDDWDLHAVVRGCCTAASTTGTATATATATLPSAGTLSSSHEYLHVLPFCSSAPPCIGPAKKDVELPDLFEELHELSKPFFAPKSEPLILQNAAVSPLPLPLPPFGRPSNGAGGRVQIKRPSPVASSRSKRRKSQFKKVCQVPAENLSSDIWAWRKYGQKPIKGSPYPRGYYRCSSSKGCLARKQVERNRSDPGMFVVTYTGEHNHPAPTHRNSLAGSTRQKPATSGDPPSASNVHVPPPSSSPATSPEEEEEAMPQSTSRGEHDDSMEDDEDGEVGLSHMALDDDFFVGLEGLLDDDREDCFLDRFPANFGLSWDAATNSSVTTAGGS
ncbi:WRKY transcription factor 22 isoform X2 [Punica granatum]|uniref:WRKY transcription factor 22 isoform X2 n=1 Tax=Punica granatum TaxID=22663 RepID=A0A218XTN1_PUNGR|nr:WRKY transcription factor 22 isoform X2 [Punica granatum]OWM88168.1 hypothetical protein CDL15_Pgr003580 [Punica granatum]